MLMIVLMALAVLCTTDANAQKRRNQQKTVQRDTVAVLKEKANAGDNKAQNTLGTWYYTGKNVQKDYVTALKYWALSAKQNNAEAIGNMAMCYQLGHGTEKDSIMAVKLYKKAFEQGNTEMINQHVDQAERNNSLFSTLLLHEVYRDGIGVAKDSKKAQQYLKKGAEAGDTDSQKKWALMLLNSKNPEEAAKWFKTLADKGNATGVYYYGYLLYKGMGIQQDKGAGVKYLQRAADAGMVPANRILATAYYDGEGVEQDYSQAVEYLKKAVKGKFPESQILLAKCYVNGQGVNRDYDQAAQWFAEAFAQNSKQAEEVKRVIADETNNDFNNYVNGLRLLYVDQNFAEAQKLFKKVEKAGIAEGLTMQGLCMADDQNVKANIKKAFKVLDKAAANSTAAQYYLAQLYQEGKGVEKDTHKATELILKAADNGNGYAMEKAGNLYFDGTGVSQDYVKAATYYLMAEAQSKLTPTSARNLARCYTMGIASLPDKEKAQERIEALNKVQNVNRLNEMLKKM